VRAYTLKPKVTRAGTTKLPSSGTRYDYPKIASDRVSIWRLCGIVPRLRRSRNLRAASLLPRGEKDRLRGFGRWSLILKLPNPLTPPSPLWGEGDHGRCPCHFFVDISPYCGYCIILAPVKDVARRHTVSWERGRCPRAGLQPAPGRLGHHVSRHYDRGGRCIPGLGQAKAGNARSDRVPGSLA
jgi:hypothetical protein